MERRHNPVFRSLNRALTLMGAERKFFFFALMMGAGVFTQKQAPLTDTGNPTAQEPQSF